ncbi:MAG: hypothetical protein WDO24_08130 [Pseudomonadota bacterium]
MIQVDGETAGSVERDDTGEPSGIVAVASAVDPADMARSEEPTQPWPLLFWYVPH